MTCSKPSVLFVCIGNACRSPMAEAIARHLGAGVWEVASAGTSPAGWVSEEVRAALDEVDIPAEGLVSQGLDEHDLHSFEFVVILSGARPGEVVPEEFAGKVLDWSMPDPVGMPLRAYRQVREDLMTRIPALLDEVRKDAA